MTRFRLQVGSEFSREGAVYRIIDKILLDGQTRWLLTNMITGEGTTQTQQQLEQAYADGELTRYVDPGKLTGIARSEFLRRAKKQYDDLSDTERRRLDARRSFLKYIAKNMIPGAKTAKLPNAGPGEPRTMLEKLVQEAATHAGLPAAPSVATYYRWKLMTDAEDTRGLIGRFSERGNRTQLDPLVRQTTMSALQRKLDEAINSTRVGKFERLTLRDVEPEIEKALSVARFLNPGLLLKTPSRATLYSWWQELPAVKRDIARYGFTKARQNHRFIRGHDEPQHALDEVEYDESEMPFFFYDEDTLLPLGRATISWFLDVFCHSINGFYLGFEPASDLAMMSAAKHMCLPKAYVNSEYPHIINPYMQHGIPRFIRVDNSKPAWGNTAEELCARLDIDWDWCPARTPYFKPIVEGMFRILNEELLSMLPGNITPRFKGREDYDPTANGVIGFRHFLYIFHKYIVDSYHPSRQRLLGNSPNARFLSGTTKIAPGLIDRAIDLKMLFAVVREARSLNHKGVVYEGNPYGGDELQQLRLQSGHTQKVRIKVDPSDLSVIWVWDKRNETWLRATSRKPENTTGVSLHVNTIIRKHEQNLFGTDGDRRREAYLDLRQMITDSEKDALSIRMNKLIARLDGVGTQNIFSNLNHDGKLGSLTGPFAGLSLNPLSTTAPQSVTPEGSRAEKLFDGFHDHNPAGQESVPPKKRARKSFSADKSLG